MTSSNQRWDDSPSRAIGWVVLDHNIQPQASIFCSAVVLRVLYKYNDTEHHIVECIVLEADTTDGLFRRVGRGRIEEKA